MSTTVKYKGSTLTTAINQTKVLETAGKYLEDNVEIIDVTSEGSGSGYVWQDTQGYVHLSDEAETPLQTKTVTPTEASQSVTPDAGYYALNQVNVSAISSSYVGSGIARRSSSDLTASGATVTVPSGYYSTQASKAVSAGTEGTPTVSKGTVTYHAVTVTPSVTNTAGYISGGTHTGTGVTITASELVGGSQTVATNGTYNVTNFAELIVNVPNVDCPVFTGVYDDNVITMSSCSMTFSECSDLAQSGKTHAFLDMTVGAQVQRVPIVCNSIGSVLRYDYNGSARFNFSITYNSNGTITYIEPSAATTLFTVSQSGNNQTDSAERLIGAVSVPAGTAGTPTATKGQVSNAQVTVTPSVTNSAGWINGGTKAGTPVTVTARELVSGNTLYADASGSWDVATAETLVIPDASSTVSATKGTVSNHSVSVTPRVVTSSHGWMDTGTVTGTVVSVSASELVSGSETKTSNGTYDVTNLAELIVNVQGGGGGAVKMGVLRPDAELLQRWSVNRLFVTDDGGTIPAYSTSTTTLFSGASLSPSIPLDVSAYDYMWIMRGLVTPVYSNATASAGRFLAHAKSYCCENIVLPAGYVNAYGGATQQAAGYVAATQDLDRTIYCSSATNIITSTPTTKYGIYMVPTAVASATQLNIKSPSVYIRGSSSYLSQANWELLTDIHYQYVIEVYRVPKVQGGVNGFNGKTQLNHIIDCYNNGGSLL